MTRALFKHELRLRRQALALALALAVCGPWVAEALLGALGPLPAAPSGGILARGLTHPVFADLLTLALAALALHTATDAFPAQRDRGTDAFLAGLPLAPRSVYAARALTCAAVVALVPLLRHPLYLAGHLVLGDWPPGFLARVAAPLFLSDLLRAVVFSGLALSFAQGRRLGWILAAVLLLGLRALTTYGALDPACDLLRFASPGAEVAAASVWPRLGASCGWLVLAGASFFLGYSRFVAREDALAQVDSALERGALVPALARSVSLLALAAVPLCVAGEAVKISPTTATYPDAQVTAHTARFRFTFPARLSARARRTVAEADRIYARVAALMGATKDEASPLNVVLTDGSLARGDPEGAPRIDLDRSPRLALAQLSSARLLRGRLGDRLTSWERATQTFAQGVCRSVAWRAVDGDPFGSRFQAAVYHSRRPFRLSEVFDRRQLRVRGEEAGPALGEAFVEGLARERGLEVIPALLTILEELPARRVESADQAAALWREVFAKAGLEIEQVEERLLAVLEDEVLEDPRSRVALPRLRVILQIQEKPIGWRIVAVPDQNVPDDWYVVCDVRRAPPGESEVTSPLRRRLGAGLGALGWGRRVQPEDASPRPQRLGPDPAGFRTFFLRSSPFRGAPWVRVGLSRVDPMPLLSALWEEWESPEGRP